MAEKIIDGSHKENIYYLLCNLADLDNKSIVLAAINRVIESTKLDKEETDKAVADVTERLERAKRYRVALKSGPDVFLHFVKEFNDNEVLVDYLSVLGYDDCLKDFMESHKEEQKTNNMKEKVEKDIATLSDQLHRLEVDASRLEVSLKDYNTTLDNINNATADAKTLIEASMNHNGTFNKDFVEQTFAPFEEQAKIFGIVFPDKFVEEASKAIFFPQDGFDKVVEEYRQGKFKELLYTNNEPEKIDMDAIDEEVIKEVPINNVDITEVEPAEEEPVEEEPVEEEATNEIEATDEIGEPEVTEEISEDIVPEIEDESIIEEVSNDRISADDLVEEPNEGIKGTDISNVADRIIDEMNDEVANLEVVQETKNEYGLYDSKISEKLETMLANADKKLIESNIENLRALNVSDDTFYYVSGDYSYLTDKDLASKLNYLRGKNVSEKAVLSAVEAHYIDCSLESIKEGVNALENSELGFDKKFMAIFKYGVDNFFKTLENLGKNGIEPDDSEISSYLSILARYSENIAPDTEILKDYGISLLRKNGKYELGLYLKKPADLVQAIDDIIEIGEEALINSTPEVLAMDTDTVLERINYYKNNNIDYKEGEVYAEPIIKPGLFNREFNDPELEPIGTRVECNVALEKSLNNDLCSIFIEVLDKFYNDERSYKAVELSEDEAVVFEELKGLLEKEFNAKLINKNTYEMNEVTISRNKFERNLSCLVSALLSNGEDLLSEAREVLIVSALYNSRRAVGMIMNIPHEVEKDTASLGGMAA